MRMMLALLVLLAVATPAAAQRFVAVAFHDVVDDEAGLESDAILTGRLVAFFDWLRGNGWHPVSLDDIAAARGGKPLPPKAILLTFDDGERSAYTRVYPLLLAYRYPALFSLVGAWMDAPPDATVDYGGQPLPRSHFLSWQEAREMARSGLAEFASHSYDLHRGILANPQGSMPPAAATWAYDPRSGHYETDAELSARVLRDLRRSVQLMRQQLGRAPRALVWPFGRYSGPAEAAANEAGFQFVLTLDPEPADTSRPMSIPRLFPSRDPTLASLAEGLRFDDPTPVTRRVVCLALDSLPNNDAVGRTIEAMRRLGANTVVLDPGSTRPSDMLRFAAWQLRTRAGVELFLRIHPLAVPFVRDLVRVAPIDGLLMESPGNLLSAGDAPNARYPWIVRAARDNMDTGGLDLQARDALAAWREAVAERPGLRLALVSPANPQAAWPAAIADWLLVSPSADGLAALSQRLARRGWLSPQVTSRVVLPAIGADAAASIRAAQVLGATGFSLCPAPALPAEPRLAAAFSAATFPLLP